jgi:hypothetical protein
MSILMMGGEFGRRIVAMVIFFILGGECICWGFLFLDKMVI